MADRVDPDEQARRLREIEGTTERVEAQVRQLLRQQEHLSRVLLQRLTQLEQGLGAHTTPGSPIVPGSP
jgi:hypothetical protein